jgi:hypothetical protein
MKALGSVRIPVNGSLRQAQTATLITSDPERRHIEPLERVKPGNGLPIMLKRPYGGWEIEELDQYHRDCVIGGLGAFLIPVRKKSQFAEAIKDKIARGIADRSQVRALVQPACAEQPRCLHDPCSENGSAC